MIRLRFLRRNRMSSPVFGIVRMPPEVFGWHRFYILGPVVLETWMAGR